VATNARLTKPQANRMATMAHDGFARAIVPSHTLSDGDTIFALGTGGFAREVNLSLVGALAADVVADAILRAVREATGLPDYPSVKDLR
jgi:L-aminopeptidase/D-esterase-like protein